MPPITKDEAVTLIKDGLADRLDVPQTKPDSAVHPFHRQVRLSLKLAC